MADCGLHTPQMLLPPPQGMQINLVKAAELIEHRVHREAWELIA